MMDEGDKQNPYALDAAQAACRALAHMADGYLAHLESPAFDAAVLAPLFNAMKAALGNLADHTNAIIQEIGYEEDTNTNVIKYH